jgi:hypothetical protein
LPGGFPPGLGERLPSPRRSTTASPDSEFSLRERDGRYVLSAGRRRLVAAREVSVALEWLESRLHQRVARAARGKLFVHAGVVGWRGRAIVIPGRTMRGKSTLVAALVRAGADYYSDEFAVLDRRGYVWPYLKRLSLRRAGQWPARVRPEQLGGSAGREALPLGIVLVTSHRTGARWEPRAMSRAEAMVALFDNTVLARVRPQFALATLRRAVEACQAVEGPRGDARRSAPRILAAISRAIESGGDR